MRDLCKVLTIDVFLSVLPGPHADQVNSRLRGMKQNIWHYSDDLSHRHMKFVHDMDCGCIWSGKRTISEIIAANFQFIHSWYQNDDILSFDVATSHLSVKLFIRLRHLFLLFTMWV